MAMNIGAYRNYAEKIDVGYNIAGTIPIVAAVTSPVRLVAAVIQAVTALTLWALAASVVSHYNRTGDHLAQQEWALLESACVSEVVAALLNCVRAIVEGIFALLTLSIATIAIHMSCRGLLMLPMGMIIGDQCAKRYRGEMLSSQSMEEETSVAEGEVVRLTL
jgi:hypothetical protein